MRLCENSLRLVLNMRHSIYKLKNKNNNNYKKMCEIIDALELVSVKNKNKWVYDELDKLTLHDNHTYDSFYWTLQQNKNINVMGLEKWLRSNKSTFSK